MAIFDIYICAYHKSGSYCNGSHCSSNGFVYSYTEIDKTILYLSIPINILSNSIIEDLKGFLEGKPNQEIRYSDWEDFSKGVEETELDITELLRRLNRNINGAEYRFKKGDRDLCSFVAKYLIPEVNKFVDMRDCY